MRIEKDPDEDNYNILVENFGQETEIEEDIEIETTTIPDTTEDSPSVWKWKSENKANVAMNESTMPSYVLL